MAQHKQMTEQQKKVVSAAAIAGFILLLLAVGWLVGRPMLQFVSQPEQFRQWVDAQGLWGRVLFVGMVVLQVIVAVIPGEPLEIGAGYAFGAVEGTVLCLIGAVIGSALVLLLVRRCGIKLVEAFFPREKIESLAFLRDHNRLNLLVFIVFLIPGTPKDLLCYVVGLTGIRLRDWLLIAGIARIPSVITSTIGGNALGTQQYSFAAIVFAVTAVISIAGILLYRRICQKQNAKENGK